MEREGSLQLLASEKQSAALAIGRRHTEGCMQGDSALAFSATLPHQLLKKQGSFEEASS